MALGSVRFKLRVGTLHGLSLTMWVAPQLVLAQQAASPEPPEAPSDSDNTLQEIVVIAERRKANLQDVPVTVTALPASSLESAGVTGTTDLANVVSGLTMPQSQGTPMPHIRGVGNTAIGTGIENSVALYVDGVYRGSPSFSALTFNNIAQVEVAKGPQGTLFGRNATGGLMQVITLDPLAGFSGSAQVGYGNFNTVTEDMYVTGGSGVLAGDLAFQSSQQLTGWGTNLYNDEQVNKQALDLSTRSKWVFNPADGTAFKLIFDYAENNSSIGALRNYGNTPNIYYPQGFAGLPTFDVDNNVQPSRDKKGGGVSLQLDQDATFASLVNTVAWRQDSIQNDIDIDTGPLPIVAVLTHSADTQFTEEFQLLSPSGSSWRWVTGLYYYYATSGNLPGNTFFGGAAVNPLSHLTQSTNDSTEYTHSEAAYGQVTKEVLHNTDLTLGARFTHEERSVDSVSSGVIRNVTPTTPTYLNKSDATDVPTWRVGLEHHFTDDVMAYISDSRGFRAGAYNATQPTQPAIQPETLDAYEIGTKANFLDDRVRMNTSAFYYKYTNMQVPIYAPAGIIVLNAANARLYGADWSLDVRPLRNLTISTGVEWLHTQYRSFDDAPFNTPETEFPFGNCGSCSGSAAGNQMPVAPDFTSTARINYVIPLPIGTIDLNADDNYNSGWWSGPDNLARQGAYNFVNALAGWTSPDGRYRVTVWGKNLGNEAVASRIASLFIGNLETLLPPRTYGVTVRYTLGK